MAIVSLFVLTGYSLDVMGECCAHHLHGQAEHGDQAPGTGDDCQCLCHQSISPVAAEPVRVVDAALGVGDVVAHADEFPPDAVPLGIDYPPQLA